MNCQRARETFPELLDTRTPATAHLDARAHLAACPDCQREFAALNQTLTALDTLPTPSPSPRLRKSFYAMLEEEKHSAVSVHAATERHPRARRVTLWRWVLFPFGAAALVALGVMIGQRTQPPSVTTTPEKSAQEIALNQKVQRLEDQLTKVSNLMAASLLQHNQRPANDRMRGVFASATQENPTDKAINDLIAALAFDPSANVRLRALDGLAEHANDEVVRAAVLASLSREQNPLVQVSMIDFLAAAQDLEAKSTLQKLSANDNADQNVRAAARRALLQL